MNECRSLPTTAISGQPATHRERAVQACTSNPSAGIQGSSPPLTSRSQNYPKARISAKLVDDGPRFPRELISGRIDLGGLIYERLGVLWPKPGPAPQNEVHVRRLTPKNGDVAHVLLCPVNKKTRKAAECRTRQIYMNIAYIHTHPLTLQNIKICCGI